MLEQTWNDKCQNANQVHRKYMKQIKPHMQECIEELHSNIDDIHDYENMIASLTIYIESLKEQYKVLYDNLFSK